jgi:Tol biopolymer transport system component
MNMRFRTWLFGFALLGIAACGGGGGTGVDAGPKVYFVRGGNQILSLDLGSGAEASILTSTNTIRDLRLSPDRKHLIYADPSIHIVDVDGQNERAFPLYYEADWVNDTEIMLVSLEVAEKFYTVNLDGTNLSPVLYNSPPGHTVRSIDVNAAGTRVAFTMENPAAWNRIYTMNVDGTGAAPMTPDLTDSFSARWSPDGAKLAFTRSPDFFTGDVGVMNADGSNEILFVSPEIEGTTAFRSDGTLIFMRYVGSSADLWSMTATGTGQSAIKLTPDSESSPEPE